MSQESKPDINLLTDAEIEQQNKAARDALAKFQKEKADREAHQQSPANTCGESSATSSALETSISSSTFSSSTLFSAVASSSIINLALSEESTNTDSCNGAAGPRSSVTNRLRKSSLIY